MIILRKIQKSYSGYGDINLNGVKYHSSQVVTNYALDPIETSVDYLSDTPVAEIAPVNRKLKQFKGIVNPLKKLIKVKRKRQTKKNK